MNNYKKNRLKKLVAIVMSFALILGITNFPSWTNVSAEGEVPPAITENNLPTGGLNPVKGTELSEEEAAQIPAFVPESSGGGSSSSKARAYTATYSSTYGYDHLTAAQKTVYMQLKTMADGFNTDTTTDYTPSITYTGAGIADDGDVEEEKELIAIVTSVIYDNPQYFWIESNGYAYNDTTNILAFSVDPNYYTNAARSSKWTEITGEINTILSGVTDLNTDYEIEKYLHDEIIDEVDYAWESLNVPSGENIHHTIEGVFTTENFVVCEGYAKAFNLLMNACGVETIYVTSIDHAFNLVELEGKYYWIDLTWDDEGTGNPTTYDWFNDLDAHFLTGQPSHAPGTPSGAAYGDWQYDLPARSTTAYVPTPGVVATPTFNPAEGTYTETQNVAISTTTAGDTIRYTTDGAEPTETSTVYSTPIEISTTTTLKAKAFKAGMTDSATASATYTINIVNKYTVSFNSQGGSPVAPIENVIEGNKISAPTPPTKTDQKFDGWYQEIACTTPWDFATDTVTTYITLYAKWIDIPKYSVTFNNNNGSADDTFTNIPEGNKISQPTPNPTKAGYTFGGWYKEIALTNVWDFNTDTVTANTTLYAKWIEIPKYKVILVDSHTQAHLDTLTDIPAGSTISEPTSPTKAGYTFGGWYKEIYCTNAWDFDTDTVTANTSIYAKWIEIPKYTVIFNSNGGSAISPITDVEVNNKITAPVNPTKANYTFDGWFKNSTLTTRWDFANDTVTTNTTLYAKWDAIPVTYTVAFNSNGGSAVSDYTNILANAKISQPSNPTKTGFTFGGWYKEDTLTNAWNFNTDTVKANTTLFAKWTALTVDTFNVSFNTGGGTVIADIANVVSGATISAPTPPTRAGYTFEGWYKNILATEWNFATDTVTEDTTLFAKWTEIIGTYTVNFNSNGGSAVSPITNVSANANIAKPSNPVKTGYTFGGWYTDNTFATEWNFANDTVTADTTLIAKWTVVSVPTTPSAPIVTTPTPTIPAQIKDEINATNPAPIKIEIPANTEFKEIKAEIVIADATDKQKEALKNMTDEQIQAEIKKATDAISTVNTTGLTAEAKAKIAEIQKSLPAGTKIMPINFTVHADFAFPVEVSITVDKASYPAGTYYLYYYNESTGKVEDCGIVTVDANGTATFTISHCSDYFISSKTVDVASVNAVKTANTTDKTAKNPQTGDKTFGGILLIAITSLVTFAVVRKKRKYTIAK